MKKTGLLIVLLASVSAGGCVSKYRQALRDRENEISTLKEENTTLKAALDEARARENLLKGGVPNPNLVAANSFRGGEDAELKNVGTRLEGTGVGSDRRNGRIVLTLPDEITFASGKTTISSQGKTALKTVCDVINSDYRGRTIWIEGHTDNEPIKKSGFKSNRHLSIERAFAVLDFLKGEAGVEESRFVVVGHGEFSPIAENESKDGRKKNRRVELVIGD